jgi:hypothetical protein
MKNALAAKNIAIFAWILKRRKANRVAVLLTG